MINFSLLVAFLSWLYTSFRMDLMEHVRRPMVHGVKLQVPGARGRTLEGSMCITAFFLLYSTRKQEELDEITVGGCCKIGLPLWGNLCAHTHTHTYTHTPRFSTHQLIVWSTNQALLQLSCF